MSDGSVPVAEAGTDPARASVVEFRIHGIGNHSAWSALGNPRVAEAGTAGSEAADSGRIGASAAQEPRRPNPGQFVTSYSPPPDTDPSIWLLNWARSSRRTARFLWFLAIPLTMINVAGQMCDPSRLGKVSRAMQVAAVRIASLVMSLCVLMWAIVILETVLKHMGGWSMYAVLVRLVLSLLVVVLVIVLARGPGWIRWLVRMVGLAAIAYVSFSDLAKDLINASGLDWDITHWTPVYRFSVGVLAIGLMALVLVRAHIKQELQVTASTAWSHALLFGSVGVFVAWARPARWDVPAWLPSWATVPGPSCTDPTIRGLDYECTPHVDVVTLMIVVTTCASLMLSLLILASSWLGPKGAPRRPNNAGAALLVALAPVVLHSLGSLTRVAIDWLLTYIDVMGAYVDELPGGPSPAPFRTLTPHHGGGFIYRMDLIVLGALLLAACLCVAGLIVWKIRARGTEGQAPEGTVSPLHRWVQQLGETLAATVFWALVLFVAGVWALGRYLDDSYLLPGPVKLGIALTVQLTALLLALLYSGRLSKARDVLERFADVAGFWLVEHHPLAGASYRPKVLKGIVAEISRSSPNRVIVVGHSQGSVLAACVVGEQFEAKECRSIDGLSGTDWALITCGSPIQSLYRSFFPQHINNSFGTGHHDWTNFWRSTDPIASAIDGANNARSTDPLPGEERPRGHGDYWTDPEVTGAIRRRKH